jgi:ABC-type transport system substrate-binding protein
MVGGTMKNKSFTIGVAVILFFSVLSAAGTSHADLSGEVKVALNWDPTTVNMLDVKLGIDLTPVLHMHQGLMSADIGTGERSFRNALAQSAEVLENGKDIKFIMKKGNIFHTGDLVTARDVKFTYEQCVNPSNANLMAGPLDEIEEVEVLDDITPSFFVSMNPTLPGGLCSGSASVRKITMKRSGKNNLPKNLLEAVLSAL